MIIIDKTVVSDDIADQHFVCDLARCKGTCCEQGDAGAPLTAEECETLDAQYDQIAPFLTAEGRDELDRQGLYVIDSDGDLGTPTIKGGICAYGLKDKNGHIHCGIERAWKAGKTDFRKPISCHLYPIRITEYPHYEAVNYHRWHICRDACHNGKALQVPLYLFLKEPLIRKYGTEWYEALTQAIAHQQNSATTR